MRVVVLGAGVVGVATAYYLAEDGHDVTVIDRQPAPALETSFGNAGNVCPSYATPWAAPGMRWKALKWLVQSEAPLRVDWRADGPFLRWVLAWLANCSRARFERNKPRMQRLSRYSLACLQALRDATGIAYDQTTRGILQLLRTEAELAAIVAHTRILDKGGIPYRVLAAGDCVAIEPALAHAQAAFAGGLHLPLDETGDCNLFAQALAERASQHGARFRMETVVERLALEGARVVGVVTGDGSVRADRVVVALGIGSVSLLDAVGVRVPIQPVKGYSLTLPIARFDRAPQSSVMDEHTKVAITRLGNRVRAAGTAELGAASLDAPRDRFATILRALRDLFPEAGNADRASYWAGLRPMTPDGPPILGRTGVAGLYVNVGHGAQGWSMACGSGRIVAHLVSDRKPDIDIEGLTLERYA
jgi:D-amino-acid dehydrogenase